jgi:hypothetical protein
MKNSLSEIRFRKFSPTFEKSQFIKKTGQIKIVWSILVKRCTFCKGYDACFQKISKFLVNFWFKKN